MRQTIFQKAWYVDLLPFVVYNVLSHFVFAPEPWAWTNWLVTLGFVWGQAVAVYGTLRYAVERPLLPAWGIGLFCFALGLLAPYPLFLAAGILGPLEGSWTTYQAYLFPAIFWSVFTLVLICLALHLYFRRRAQVQRNRELEQANTRTELAYLRGQLNPHFLFNALNSIHVLIRRDPDLAADSLAEFSDLLRYQLYRADTPLIPLTEELEQVERFAELSLLRQEEDFRWRLNVDKNTDGYQVPPLLLQPLIENAFKHNTQFGGWVRMDVATEAEELRVTIANRTGPEPPADAETGGIGLANIRRRLELLYADAFTLDATRAGDTFTLKLRLPWLSVPSS